LQTFLPYEDFVASAHVLDDKRLGKQRVEALQVLRVIKGEQSGWARHPVCQMWWDYPYTLGVYTATVCLEWIGRGFRDNCYEQIIPILGQSFDWLPHKHDYPPWLGFPDLHISHQSNLVRKDPVRYGPQFPLIPDTIRYVWPVP
jgi:hypothetical protein